MFRPTDEQPEPPKPEQEKTMFEMMMGMTDKEWDAVMQAQRELDNE